MTAAGRCAPGLTLRHGRRSELRDGAVGRGRADCSTGRGAVKHGSPAGPARMRRAARAWSGRAAPRGYNGGRQDCTGDQPIMETTIESIYAREELDSGGNPTVAVEGSVF